MNIYGVKPIIHNDLKLSRPKQLFEATSMEKTTEIKFIIQQDVSFETPQKVTRYNDSEYHHL